MLKKNLNASIVAKVSLLNDYEQLDVFDEMVKTLITSHRQGGRFYIAGNGGSAADSQHLAAEFISKLARPRNPLPAQALTTDSSVLTAIGNDFGFEEVFKRQLQALVTSDDVFIAITTSGNSPNIIKALEYCSRIPTLLLTGGDGGKARALATHCIIAPGEATSTIQEVHQVIYHSLCEAVENAVFFSQG